MNLDELEVYQEAMRIGETVWENVAPWDFFAKDTVGKQWVRAAASMAANLSEGFGRFHYKENKQYGYYSRGSLFETRTGLTKARNRSLVSQEVVDEMSQGPDTLGRRLNAYSHSIGPRPDRVKESTLEWDTDQLPGDANDSDH